MDVQRNGSDGPTDATRQIVEAYLKALPENRRRPLPRAVRDIMLDVAHDHGMSVPDMLDRDRDRQVFAARKVAIHRVAAMKDTAGQQLYSYNTIAEFFRRDRTTILHALGLTQHGRNNGHARA